MRSSHLISKVWLILNWSLWLLATIFSSQACSNKDEWLYLDVSQKHTNWSLWLVMQQTTTNERLNFNLWYSLRSFYCVCVNKIIVYKKHMYGLIHRCSHEVLDVSCMCNNYIYNWSLNGGKTMNKILTNPS